MQARDLSGATLITASALLDMLTADELDRLVGLCLGAGCPILLTLSVIGSVEITPADPLDRRVAAAFDAHQRRTTERGSAARAGRRRLRRPGVPPTRAPRSSSRPSPWRLGPAHSALAAEWFTGWVGAACEQEPELAAECEPYARRRLEQASAGDARRHRRPRRPPRPPLMLMGRKALIRGLRPVNLGVGTSRVWPPWRAFVAR